MPRYFKEPYSYNNLVILQPVDIKIQETAGFHALTQLRTKRGHVSMHKNPTLESMCENSSSMYSYI